MGQVTGNTTPLHNELVDISLGIPVNYLRSKFCEVVTHSTPKRIYPDVQSSTHV